MATVEESVLRMEMTGLESLEEDAPRRVLFFKSMSWLGQIRTHRRDESWSDSLYRRFFPQFQVDALGDHLCTCTTHSGGKKAHDWAVDQLPDLFRTTHKVKTHQVVKVGVSIVVTSNW